MKKLQSEVEALKYRLAEMEEVFAAFMLPAVLEEYQRQRQSKSRAAARG